MSRTTYPPRDTILREKMQKSTVYFGTWYTTSFGAVVCVDRAGMVEAANDGNSHRCWYAVPSKLRFS